MLEVDCDLELVTRVVKFDAIDVVASSFMEDFEEVTIG